jgi:hypothetical protein
VTRRVVARADQSRPADHAPDINNQLGGSLVMVRAVDRF